MRLPIPVLSLLLLGAACGGAPHDPAAPVDLVRDARRLDLDGDHAAAVTLYRQALGHDPDSFDAHYGIGRALDLAGAYEEARGHFARAVELADDGSKDQAQRMLGVSWVFSRNLDEAARAFRSVYERRLAAGSFAGAAEVANELGRVHLELDDPAGAETWYRTGHETSAREMDAAAPVVDLADLRWAHARARIAARQGRADEARAEAAEVRRLIDKGGNRDQEVQYAYLIGYLELHLGNPEAALAALADADQEDPFIPLLEARAHEALDRTDAARDAYRRVLTSASHGITNAFARPIAREKLDDTR